MSRILTFIHNGIILIMVLIILIFYTPLEWDDDLYVLEYILLSISFIVFTCLLVKRSTGFRYSIIAGWALLLLTIFSYSSVDCSQFHCFRFKTLVSQLDLWEFSYSNSETYNAILYGLLALWLTFTSFSIIKIFNFNSIKSASIGSDSSK